MIFSHMAVTEGHEERVVIHLGELHIKDQQSTEQEAAVKVAHCTGKLQERNRELAPIYMADVSINPEAKEMEENQETETSKETVCSFRQHPVRCRGRKPLLLEQCSA